MKSFRRLHRWLRPEPPGAAVVTPSVLVIARSASGSSVSSSVAELFAELVSVTPSGRVTVAVLLSVPVAADEMVQLAV